MKKSRLLLFVLTMCLATLGTWGQTTHTWDFSQAVSTADQENIQTELSNSTTDANNKTTYNGLWAANGNNGGYMNNTKYNEFAQLKSTGETLFGFTEGLYFKIDKNNVRIEPNKYIQMRDGTQIKIPNLKKGWTIVIKAQKGDANNSLSYDNDSDQLEELTDQKVENSKDVTIVNKVKVDGDVAFTINTKNSSNGSAQLYVYSITVQEYTTKTEGKKWDFTSWDATDITNLQADAPEGTTGSDGKFSNGVNGENWCRKGSNDRFYNVKAISDAELVAKNGDNTPVLTSTAGIKFTVKADGKVRIYNESKSKYLYIEKGTNGTDNNFKLSLKKGQRLAVSARSGSGSTSASIAAVGTEGITKVSGEATTSTAVSYVFDISADGNYTFYASDNAMFIFSMAITEYTLDSDTEGGTDPSDPTEPTEPTDPPTETEKAFVILTAGQSNADGRIKDALTYDYQNVQISYCNGKDLTLTEGDFKTFDATCDADGKRWGFDAVVYQHVSEALKKPFYVIKETKGSTAIHPDVNASSNAPCWSADATFLSSATSANQGGRSLLMGLIDNVKASVDKLTDGYDIKCLLWHQGESDRKYGSVYYDNLKATIGYIRDQLATATGDDKYKTLPVICGTVSKYSGQYNKDVEDAINKLATEDANFHVIDMSDATFLSDGYHFDAASATYLGGEMFNKMIDLGLITADKVETTKPTPVTDGSTTYDFKQWATDNLNNSDKKTATLTLADTELKTLDGETSIYTIEDPTGTTDDLFLQGRFATTNTNKPDLYVGKGLRIQSKATTLSVLDLQPGDAVYADFSAGSSVSSILSFLSNNAFLEGSSTDATAIAKGDALTTKKNYIIKTGTQLDLTFGSQETASYYIASLKITPAKMTETIAVPTISKVEEEGKATVTLTATATNLRNQPAVYYTTDGTTPTTESTLYTEPFELTEAGEYTVKAIAVSNDKSSEAATETVTVEVITPKKPKVLKDYRVENGATIYTITFMDGETLHYTLPGSETEQTVTTGTSVEVQVTVSGKLTAYTTRGGLKSAENITNVYAPAPAVASDDSYDFSQLSSMTSDMTLAFDGTVTVGGATLHKPNALTATTFGDRFAFSEGTDWMLLKAGRLRAKKGNAAKQMAVLGLQAGQVISITYSNNNIALHYTAASGTATLEGLEDNAALENKKFYTVGTAGDLLLTVPADESNNCEMTKIELNVVEDVPAPVLTKREGKENVVDVTVGKSSIGNTVTTYYTTDGSTPTANSTLLEKSSITVKQTSTIRAITISSSGKASEVSNAITLTISDDYTMASTTTDNGGVEVTEVTNPAGSTITIPASVGEQQVTAIAEDAFSDIPAEAKATVQTIDLSATQITGVEVSRESGVFAGFPETTLIFMPEGNTVASGAKNVIVNGACNDFEMQDGQSYTIPEGKSFTATQATLNRTFTANTKSTVCLPYAFTPSEEMGKFYEFTAISGNTVTMTQKTGELTSNQPYIFIPAAEATGITASNVTVSISDSQASAETGGNTFTFQGVIADKTFSSDEIASGIYGFAAESDHGATAVGQFVKCSEGASVAAFRAYLQCSQTLTGDAGASAAHALQRTAGSQLPSVLNVRFVDADGSLTGVDRLTLTGGDEAAAYGLDGQRVSNNHKGIVIKNGKKVVNK